MQVELFLSFSLSLWDVQEMSRERQRSTFFDFFLSSFSFLDFFFSSFSFFFLDDDDDEEEEEEEEALLRLLLLSFSAASSKTEGLASAKVRW